MINHCDLIDREDVCGENHNSDLEKMAGIWQDDRRLYWPSCSYYLLFHNLRTIRSDNAIVERSTYTADI